MERGGFVPKGPFQLAIWTGNRKCSVSRAKQSSGAHGWRDPPLHGPFSPRVADRLYGLLMGLRQLRKLMKDGDMSAFQYHEEVDIMLPSHRRWEQTLDLVAPVGIPTCPPPRCQTKAPGGLSLALKSVLNEVPPGA